MEDQPRRQTRFGRWATTNRLGGGGNGDVWRVRDSDGYEAALKVLRATNRMNRFRREIEFLLSVGDRPGILPLIDHELPTDNSKSAWYVMPIATPLKVKLGEDPAISQVVRATLSYSATLRDLATDGIGHRDIKPDNLFYLEESWRIGDFGLVAYPEREPITEHGRKVGPVNFLAPEMREDPDTASAELADVYSLAKTLWVLLAGANIPLPGQHRVDDDFCRLTLRVKHHWAPYLDNLIQQATANDPARRPTMSQFHDELNALVNPAQLEEGSLPNLADIARDISIIAQPHTSQRRQQEVLTLEATKSALLLEETVRAAFQRVLSLLPDFYINDPVQVASPRSWLTLGAYSNIIKSWGASMFVPDAGAWATYGCILRVIDDEGSAKVYVIVEVNRHNEGRGERTVVLEREFESRVPSAHLESIITQTTGLLEGTIAPVLVEIKRMMEAEVATHLG